MDGWKTAEDDRKNQKASSGRKTTAKGKKVSEKKAGVSQEERSSRQVSGMRS